MRKVEACGNYFKFADVYDMYIYIRKICRSFQALSCLHADADLEAHNLSWTTSSVAWVRSTGFAGPKLYSSWRMKLQPNQILDQSELKHYLIILPKYT